MKAVMREVLAPLLLNSVNKFSKKIKCWRVMSGWACRKGTTWGRRMSSLICTALRLPAMTPSSVLWCCDTPLQTMMDPPPPNQSCFNAIYCPGHICSPQASSSTIPVFNCYIVITSPPWAIYCLTSLILPHLHTLYIDFFYCVFVYSMCNSVVVCVKLLCFILARSQL